jgi:Flp pilus assembly pilin Flp
MAPDRKRSLYGRPVEGCICDLPPFPVSWLRSVEIPHVRIGEEIVNLTFEQVVMKALAAYLADTKASTAIEYAIIAAGVALAIVAGVGMTGVEVQNKFTLVLQKFNGE